MKLLKRIKNLWRLSEINVEKEKSTTVNFINSHKEHQMSKIIKMNDSLEDFLKKDDVETL